MLVFDEDLRIAGAIDLVHDFNNGSRGTDAAESTESSYDKHSQWKRGSQGEGEGRTNKQWDTGHARHASATQQKCSSVQASSLMSLARPAGDLRRTFYHLRTTDANAQAATDENRHHAQMAHEVADRREQIREIADEGKRHWYVAIPIAMIWHSDDSHGIQIET